MTVAKDKIVSIEYSAKDQDGNEVDSSLKTGPFEYLHGHNNLIIGLEKNLEGKNPGDKFSVTIQPEEGYGEYNEGLVTEVAKSQFESGLELKVGMSFYAQSDDGPITVRVIKITDDKVTVDANHELAGKTLSFDVEVIDVVDATPEQIEAGNLYASAGGCSCGGGCGHGCGFDDDDDYDDFGHSCGGGCHSGGCSSCGGGCH